MTQSQRLLTRAGFAQLVFQLANLFLHAGERVIHQGHFMLERRDQLCQLLFFDQRRTGQILFVFAQREFCFFLPFIQLSGGLFNTTRKLFFLSQRAGGGRADFNQRVFHLLNHQTHQLLRIFRFLQQ